MPKVRVAILFNTGKTTGKNFNTKKKAEDFILTKENIKKIIIKEGEKREIINF